MKVNIIIFFALWLPLTSCGQLLFDVDEEYLASYPLKTDEYQLEIINVAPGATSADVMQFRKVAKNGSYYVINNLSNVDSLVSCQIVRDTIFVIARGKQWMEFIEDKSFQFPVDMIWTPERFPARRKARIRKE